MMDNDDEVEEEEGVFLLCVWITLIMTISRKCFSGTFFFKEDTPF